MGEEFLSGGLSTLSTPLLTDYFTNASSTAINAMNPDALTSIAGKLAEDGSNAVTNFMPTIDGVTGPWAVDSSSPQVATFGNLYTGPTSPVTDPAGLASNTSWQNVIAEPKSALDKAIGYLDKNSKAFSLFGQGLGAISTMNYNNTMAKLAKQSLANSNANTLYNRTRQETGDKNLAAASDRVFL